MERRARALPLFFTLVILVAMGRGCFADEYRFDVDEFEKKPYHLGGYAEFRPVLFGLDRNAALYRLRFFNRDEGDVTAEYNGALQLEGSLEKGIGRLFVRLHNDFQSSSLGESFRTTVYDGYLSLKPSSSLTIDIGKKSLRWGKGYAWNPVAFIDRPKDPDDPELNLEGFIVVSADYIKSFAGAVRTISITPVLLPAYSWMNDDFGNPRHINIGGKLYLLAYDTDIDLVFLTGGSKPTRYGIDFSRNITPNFEVHGEFAYFQDVQKETVDAQGRVSKHEFDKTSWLLGIRYLSESETTYIVEYYRNDAGFNKDEMRGFYSFIDNAFDTYRDKGDDTLIRKAANQAKSGYAGMNPMKDYLYVRISRKDPFGALYFTPAITSIINLNDESFSLSPEILYNGITNLELRLKANVLIGGNGSEYGEKQNDYRIELRMRYYF